jgi:hypothetical protein
MPFINIDFYLAKELVGQHGTVLLKNLLQDGMINPREYELLHYLVCYAQSFAINPSLANQAKDQLKQICELYLGAEAGRHFERLINFAEHKRNVSWGIFSRTCQFIPWENKNPLEGYLPRKNSFKRISVNQLLQFS